MPRADFSATNYLVSLSYKPADDVLVYATNSTGYRAGGLNQRASRPGEEGPFGPEKVKNYEGGIKSQLFSKKLTLNLAAYIDKYEGIQRALSVLCPDNVSVCTRILNAAEATVKGAELEASIRPDPLVSISGFAGYIDAKYDDFRNDFTGQDLSGRRFVATPKWNYGATAMLYAPIPETIGELSLAATYYGQSSVGLDDVSVGRVPAYSFVNLSATWQRFGGTPIDLRAY